jgi:amidase
MMDNYRDYDAVGLAELISKGEVTASEVIETAIAVAEKYNPTLNAIVTDMYEAAREQAKNPIPGPLSGVPFLIKDLNMVKDVPSSMGSRLWDNFVPDHDGEIVARYRKAGLVLMGKTNTPEIGLAATTESIKLGPCRNPWNLDRTTGGSSGGAGASVAAGILPAAHATDGGGSIRIPASCCGLVGLKPTRGRTPAGPDVGEGWGSMASNNVVSRSMRDSAILLDLTHGPAEGDPYHAPYFDGSYFNEHTVPPGKLKIGVDLNPASGITEVHEECLLGVKNTIELLESLGHEVVDINLDFDRGLFSTATHLLVVANVANTVQTRADYLGLNEVGLDDIESVTLGSKQLGETFSAAEYAKATSIIHQTSRYIESRFQEFDLILSPTLLQPPVPLGYMNTNDGDHEKYGDRIQSFWGFTHLYNGTGNPAISLPLHQTKGGLPVGMQFAASFGNELLLLQVGAQLEQAAPWFQRVPNMGYAL